jgi:hypothetical protein
MTPSDLAAESEDERLDKRPQYERNLMHMIQQWAAQAPLRPRVVASTSRPRASSTSTSTFGATTTSTSGVRGSESVPLGEVAARVRRAVEGGLATAGSLDQALGRAHKALRAAQIVYT